MLKRHFGIIFQVIVLLAMGTMLVTCSGGGNSAGKTSLTISGKLGSAYYAGVMPQGYFARSLAFLIPRANAAGLGVDQVIAIPMDRGSLMGQNMANSVTAVVDADGAFSLPLTKASDWLLILIDSSITGPGRYVGSVALNTGSDNLLDIPATSAGMSMLDLGTLSQSGLYNAVSSNVVDGTQFNMTASQLIAMAKTSDIFHNAMNIVNNYNVTTGIYREMRPDFMWQGDYSTLTTGTNPNSYNMNGNINAGYDFQLDTNSTAVTMDQICNGTALVQFVPPADTTDKASNTWGPSNPISSAGVSCQAINGQYLQTTGSAFYAANGNDSGNPQIVSYGMQTYFGSVPPGLWQWKENGTVVGQFDINAASPPVTADGRPKGYVPSYQLTLGSDGHQITAIDITWYYYDANTDSYVQLQTADLGVLQHFIQYSEIKFDVTYNNSRKTWNCYFDPMTTTHIVPSTGVTSTGEGPSCPAATDLWYYNDPSHPETNTGLMGFHSSGGFGYYFSFFAPMS